MTASAQHCLAFVCMHTTTQQAGKARQGRSDGERAVVCVLSPEGVALEKTSQYHYKLSLVLFLATFCLFAAAFASFLVTLVVVAAAAVVIVVVVVVVVVAAAAAVVVVTGVT